PGRSTPPCDHCAAKMPRPPQPAPPIYQPEVAARAIVWAAEHDRREIWVGGTTVGTILADRLAPGLLDRYLARTNVDAQQTDEPLDPRRPANLWEPVPGDPGAHGGFDARAHPRSAQVWATERRGLLALAGGGLPAMIRPVRGPVEVRAG